MPEVAVGAPLAAPTPVRVPVWARWPRRPWQRQLHHGRHHPASVALLTAHSKVEQVVPDDALNGEAACVIHQM
jgi:hypothetical protein